VVTLINFLLDNPRNDQGAEAAVRVVGLADAASRRQRDAAVSVASPGKSLLKVAVKDDACAIALPVRLLLCSTNPCRVTPCEPAQASTFGSIASPSAGCRRRPTTLCERCRQPSWWQQLVPPPPRWRHVTCRHLTSQQNENTCIYHYKCRLPRFRNQPIRMAQNCRSIYIGRSSARRCRQATVRRHRRRIT